MRRRRLRCISCRTRHEYSVTLVCCLLIAVTIKATHLTSPLADVSSLVFTVVIVPVAVVNEYRETVLSVIVVWVTCEERQGQEEECRCKILVLKAGRVNGNAQYVLFSESILAEVVQNILGFK